MNNNNPNVDVKTIIVAAFSMLLLLLVIGAMLLGKNSESRAEELKRITDYIVEANFKYQSEKEEANFIRIASSIENEILTDSIENKDHKFLELKNHALSLAPYGTEMQLQGKLALIDCLKSLAPNVQNHGSCSVQYALKNVKKG
ncbi:hypothetical protein OSF66_002731 [Vibrio vulnificus]|nr:hypothetical protein [Vibrio vulnificus]MCU8251606.1 hypothetical protein [Vibrio vulnificus]HDY7531091.1 hypothetical protein [Vibrio vulnificus]